MISWIKNWLIQLGLSSQYSIWIGNTILFLFAIFLSWLSYQIAKRIVMNYIKAITLRTQFQWDDAFYENKVPQRLLYFIPALVLLFFSSVLGNVLGSSVESWFIRLISIYMTWIGLSVLDALFNTGLVIYNRFPISNERPIKAYVQVFKIILYILATILIIGQLFDRSPWGFLTGLGALTAIILLVFRDSILGLVASFQLVSNRMVRVGDWIEMPKYGADGGVTEINLHTVKVKNWDNTITTIPTQALVSDSFKNWRGMEEAKGRRIKRFIYIDMNSVKFCDEEMIRRFQKIQLISEYVEKRQEEIKQSNESLGRKDISGRGMTNIGTFRAYIVAYLKQHSDIHQRMTLLVRQLNPGSNGIPIEIYVFTRNIDWIVYEDIQSNIFDHILSSIHRFDLRVFQSPSGLDLYLASQNYLKSNSKKPLIENEESIKPRTTKDIPVPPSVSTTTTTTMETSS